MGAKSPKYYPCPRLKFEVRPTFWAAVLHLGLHQSGTTNQPATTASLCGNDGTSVLPALPAKGRWPTPFVCVWCYICCLGCAGSASKDSSGSAAAVEAASKACRVHRTTVPVLFSHGTSSNQEEINISDDSAPFHRSPGLRIVRRPHSIQDCTKERGNGPHGKAATTPSLLEPILRRRLPDGQLGDDRCSEPSLGSE